MRKLLSKWVPRLLTVNQKRQRVVDSERCLELFRRNKPNFLHRYVTMDETWIHHYTPEWKRSSAVWTAVGEKRPKRPKTQMWAGKVMASVFWDAHGVLFIDYLEKGKTINSERYIGQLMRLKNEIGEKRLHMKKKKVLFHQDKMRRVTSRSLPWRNWMNWASNCFRTHHIHRIWPPASVRRTWT